MTQAKKHSSCTQLDMSLDNILANSFAFIKRQIPMAVDDTVLMGIVLSISRVADKKVTDTINAYKQKNKIKISALQKKNLRDGVLGLRPNTSGVDTDVIDIEDKINAINLIKQGLQRNRDKVLGTIISNINLLNNVACDCVSGYRQIISERDKNHSQFLVLDVNNTMSLDAVRSAIATAYDNLSNYHYMAIIFRDIDWDFIGQIAIFCEFFKTEKKFHLFNTTQQKKITEFTTFLESNPNFVLDDTVRGAVDKFFDGVAYGFQFNDLFVSGTDNTKILIMQKIELDEGVVPCPACMESMVRGNSYPRVLLKSFECQNPNCPSRSKIGRGKRYDYFSAKRNCLVQDGNPDNALDTDVLKRYRKDVFVNDGNLLTDLIRLYSFAGGYVSVLTDGEFGDNTIYGRDVEYMRFPKINPDAPQTDKLTTLFGALIPAIKIDHVPPYCRREIGPDCVVYHGDSARGLQSTVERINGVITSPPYYNAREYSQWPTLLCYLVDMAINASAVLQRMDDGAYYFYNIGDIVGQDNIFVSSHMSTKRLMLGFFSVLIFKLVGYNFLGNIIWNKGEVQSKRNSTDSVFPTYVRPVNCYEHVFIFAKNNANTDIVDMYDTVYDIPPVKKINSKGENTLGHTAPYPAELVNLMFRAIPAASTGYILDPFLGSGTTCIACHDNGYKSMGFELNDNYFALCTDRIKSVIDASDE